MYLMTCGHISQGLWHKEDGTDVPVCVICGCAEIEKECTGTDGLEGRQATCSSHKNGHAVPVQSKWELPFFRYRPDREYDDYYCGCWGWS